MNDSFFISLTFFQTAQSLLTCFYQAEKDYQGPRSALCRASMDESLTDYCTSRKIKQNGKKKDFNVPIRTIKELEGSLHQDTHE